MTQPKTKTCIICTRMFGRRYNEAHGTFEARETCSPKCGAIKRNRAARANPPERREVVTGAIVASIKTLDRPTYRQLLALAELSPEVRRRLGL